MLGDLQVEARAVARPMSRGEEIPGSTVDDRATSSSASAKRTARTGGTIRWTHLSRSRLLNACVRLERVTWRGSPSPRSGPGGTPAGMGPTSGDAVPATGSRCTRVARVPVAASAAVGPAATNDGWTESLQFPPLDEGSPAHCLVEWPERSVPGASQISRSRWRYRLQRRQPARQHAWPPGRDSSSGSAARPRRGPRRLGPAPARRSNSSGVQ